VPYRRLAIFACASLVSLWCSTGAASALDVSVRDVAYGARGDGVTNDRGAIQSAIDAVNRAGGGTVTVPGTYTYLTGNLILRSNVTLNIASGATIRQSQNPSDYANTPTRGRVIPGSRIAFITYLDQNYPLIYSGNTTNTAITGSGTIALTNSGADDNSVLVHGIGTHYANGFTIRGITISGASAYNVALRNSDNVEVSGIRTVSPSSLNSDGISIMNSGNVTVHDNDLTTMDDGIYVWASYADPRRSAWWNSDVARTSHDIEVYRNVVNNIATNGSHGFLFINWTGAAPDASRVEISRVNVHDNSFTATYPIGALSNDIYNGGAKTPTKWLRFASNRLISNVGGILARDLNTMATTDLSIDDPVYNFAVSSNVEGIYNSNFDGLNAYSTQVGTSFWSTEGTGTTGISGSNRYGEINAFDRGYASITQGVWLATGTYTFSVNTQSSGAPIRLLAVQASPLSVAASRSFTNTAWTTDSISFTVTTAGNYRLGIDNSGAGSSSTAYGRIDDARLVKTS
jgi:hypothetical protein